MLGYIGCSNTWMSVAGYATLGGSRFWPSNEAFGGGIATKWADDTSPYWDVFEGMVATHGSPEAVWIMLCQHHPHKAPNESVELLESLLTGTVANLRGRYPEMPVWLSPINGYDPADLNDRVPWENIGAAVANVVAFGLVLPGPAMPSLTATTTKNDHIHPTKPGRAVLGQSLLDFFG